MSTDDRTRAATSEPEVLKPFERCTHRRSHGFSDMPLHCHDCGASFQWEHEPPTNGSEEAPS